jgi:hypothetical protein
LKWVSKNKKEGCGSTTHITKQQTTKKNNMYQVHIFKGFHQQAINCESLEQANATVIDYAHTRGIKYHKDEHGYCHAYAGKYHVNGVEAFIFQVI